MPAANAAQEQEYDSPESVPQRRLRVLSEESRLPRVLSDIPELPTRLLGREHELTALRSLLLEEGTRLLTLVGPAGVGKTRLALEIGREMAAHFSHGVLLVDLASVHDPTFVLPSLAEALQLWPENGEPGSLLVSIAAHLADQNALFVLDSFEQVLPAAPQLAALLARCPGIVFLVTSREPVHLLWEHVMQVQPLALPDPRHLPTLEELRQVASVALFVDRVTAITPAFALTEENACPVAELCVHLDGLPLALELAAARAKLLSPTMLLQRLHDRFSLLRWPAHDLPERHQTLRCALDRSYALLTEAEQRLFRHLSVFVGGFTLEAVEEVEARLCYGGVLEPANGAQADQDGGDSLLDRLTALVDKSFVLVEEVADGVRYRLLESMRAYALAQLSTQTDEDRSVSFQQIAGPVLCGPASSVHAAASPDHACGKKQALRLLSDREEEVLRLVAQGLSNKAIAKELIISPSTVNYHLTSLFNKLGVNTRAQAVAAAAQRDLL